jgi:hypothetical protein
MRFRVDKLMPYPLESLRLAEGRADVVNMLPRLSASPLVREFVDINALGRRLAELPDADEVRAATLEAAKRGEQPSVDDSGYEMALMLAVALAEHEDALALPGPDDWVDG